MRRIKGGFTLVEVALFLAITGLLFLGVTVGVQNSIFQQRYNDSVQSFAEFLRGVYSEVTNVQNLTGGNYGKSDKAIYGKLIVFGEKFDLNLNEIGDGNDEVYVYDVVGDANGNVGTGTYNETLKKINADVFKYNDDSKKYELAGLAESYLPKWGARIEPIDEGKVIETAVLIVRHPTLGTVNTFVAESGNLEINHIRQMANEGNNSLVDVMYRLFNDNRFVLEDVDFCVAPDNNSSLRADVRIEKNARNSSGVEIFMDEGNRCRDGA